MPGFSPRVINGLVEAITGGSASSRSDPIGIYRSAGVLESFFGEAGLDLHVGAQSRVPAVRDLLREANDPADGFERIRKVIERVADPADYQDSTKLAAVVAYLNVRLRDDGFELRSVDGRYRLLALGTTAPVVSAMSEAARLLNLDSVSRDFERALNDADTDPGGAITSACSTVESVCKCLLDQLGRPYPSKKDISHLVQEVQRHLDLSPARLDILPDVKQIVTGLATVAGGIGALRTHGGDAHGRGVGIAPSEPTAARLAIHAASTLSLFLLEAWQRKITSSPK
jgi:hypothetical protein